jgi:hypothetical protein
MSITPVSAGLTHEYLKENSNTLPKKIISDKSQLVNFESSINSIDRDISELEGYIDSLNEDSNYIKKRASDYNWKFWNWPKITKDILKTLLNIQNNFKNIEKPLNKINDESNKLNSKTNTISTGSYLNNVNNPFCKDDACHIACELTKTLNSTVTVKNINANSLHEGDIVQYMSEGKYPRYLAVHKIIESKNSTTSRQLLDTTPVNVPTVLLEGTGDKIVETPLIGDIICLTVPNGMCTYDLLQNTVQIQNDINNSKKDAESLGKTSSRLDIAFEVFKWITTGLGGVSTILFVAAATSTPIPPLSAPIWILFGVSTGLFALSGIVTSSLYISYQKNIIGTNKLKFNTILNENDLNTFIKTEAKNETLHMDITTYNGLPFIKHPPIPGWREFTFIRVTDPQYGDLLPGPGLQFLYEPTEGYTGPDKFKYQYSDKYGKIKGYITVNVNINPIPLFNLKNSEEYVPTEIVDNQNKNYNPLYNETSPNLLNAFDEASNTELTNEQKQYLETHQNKILKIAETILYNLQTFLNILLTNEDESSVDENPTQRKLLTNKAISSSSTKNKYTNDANGMIKHLDDMHGLNGDDIADEKKFHTRSCTYEELLNGVQNGTYNDKVIVQVRDGEYVRYMKLINITDTSIELKSGEKGLSYSPEKFKNNSVPNSSDPRFNILIVPASQDNDDILKNVWKKQINHIEWLISLVGGGKIVCATLIGVGGISVVAAGAYRVGDYCNSRTRQIITEQIINIGDPEERAALLQPNQLTKTYTRITEEISNDNICNKKTTAISIVICGALITIGSIAGYILSSKYEQNYSDDKTNLNKYEPN